jgi:hypothetical protein
MSAEQLLLSIYGLICTREMDIKIEIALQLVLFVCTLKNSQGSPS